MNAPDAPLDTDFIESIYYAYYKEGGILVLERFEGDKATPTRVSVEERSTVLHEGHVAQKSETLDPDGTIAISTSFTWKQTKDALGNQTSTIYTVTETYAQGYSDTNKLLLTTEYTRRMSPGEKGTTKDIIGVATLTEVYEAGTDTSIGTETSVRMTYRVKGKPDGLDLKADKDTLITVTKVYEAGFDITKDTPTSITYTYKVVEKIDDKNRLVTYTDSFVGDVFDTRTKTYYDNREIRDGSTKPVQVTENWIGNNIAIDSFSYTYWKNDVDTANGKKTVKVTENYLDLNGNNTIDTEGTDPDTAFIESIYYAYYKAGGILVLERLEGDKLHPTRVSIEERSTVLLIIFYFL